MNDQALRLGQQLCFALHAATRAMVQAYQPELAPLGLTYPQYLVMLVLWEGDGISVKQLGERLELDSGTLTPLLKRLEGEQLILRNRSITDERVVQIHLTAKGRKLKARALNVPRAMASKVGLPAARFVALREELRELSTILRHVVAPQ